MNNPGSEPPEIALLSDKPIQDKVPDKKSKETHDLLDLHERLRVHLDTLRHPGTETPFTIALYGQWGTGKTSAMKWLASQLELWNKSEKREQINERKETTYPHLTPVWFYPWKYHKREDVWRGIIAEVILATLSVDIRDDKGKQIPLAARLSKASKQFGKFLGHSFLHALSNVKFDAKAFGSGIEVSGQAFQDIYQEYLDTARQPHAPFLNDFENQLTAWVKETFNNKDRRLVIFIDDLDRCLPDVALEVLEALKLYLNIPGLLFVAGLDREVIDQIVTRHYHDLGVDAVKAASYLDKLFQVEFDVHPSDHQAEGYFKKRIEALNTLTGGIWAKGLNPRSNDPYTEAFRTTVEDRLLVLGDDNPRSANRLINSLLVRAGAARKMEGAGNDEDYRFAQGAQVFLIERMIDGFVDPFRITPNPMHNEPFRAWLEELSKKRIENPEEPLLIETDSTAPQHEPWQERARMNKGLEDKNSGEKERITEPASSSKTRYSEIFLELAKKAETLPNGIRILKTLGEKKWWDLLLIEFSAKVASASASETSTSRPPSPTSRNPEITKHTASEILLALPDTARSVIVRELDKPLDKIELSDLAKITRLDLSEKELASMDGLQFLPNLESVDLSQNQISDPSQLNLPENLTTLYLRNNQISDPSQLNLSENLTELDLRNNQISDTSQLNLPENLTELYLSHNQISDPSQLNLPENLTTLYLWNNQISDPSQLNLPENLTTLDLSQNQISDPSQLNLPENLTELDLKNNQISDPSQLNLPENLTELYLRNNQISDPSQLNLPENLTTLYLSHNQISDPSQLNLPENLTELDLRNNQISDPSQLNLPENLTELYLSNNQISAPPQLNLPENLTTLYLSHNQISDTSQLNLPENLTTLYLWNNQISDPSQLNLPENLTTLYLSHNQISDPSQLNLPENLARLDLSQNQISDPSQLSLPENLTTLYLRNNQISDPSQLNLPENLTKLYLNENPCASDSHKMENLKSSHPRIKILH